MPPDAVPIMVGAMRPELTRLREALDGHTDIRQAIVFGSVAAGTARAGSDLDIAVAAERPLSAERRLELIESLALASGRPVDLIDLRTAGEPLLGQILQNGVRLRGSDAEHAELVRRHLFDAADFLPYVERMLEERRQRWIG